MNDGAAIASHCDPNAWGMLLLKCVRGTKAAMCGCDNWRLGARNLVKGNCPHWKGRRVNTPRRNFFILETLV